MFNIKDRAKWDAWKAVEGSNILLSQACARFCEYLTAMDLSNVERASYVILGRRLECYGTSRQSGTAGLHVMPSFSSCA